MNSPRVARIVVLLLAVFLSSASEPSCIAQIESATKDSTHEAELERIRAQRREFQAQQLITARPNSWIFNLADPPRIVWRDLQTVRDLGFEGPLRVRWFNAQFEEHPVPDEPGRWGAWIEGTAPNGTPLRRSLTFYSPPKNSFMFFAPEIKVSLPQVPGSAAVEIWREHEAELAQLSTNLLRQTFIDSPLSAVVMAGLAESKPLGRPARFVESVDVLNEDYHLALKLKLHGIQDQVRPLQPPRQRETPATVLHPGSPVKAGMRPDAKAKIDAVCRAWFDDTGEPFVTLVARRGVIITHEAFGKDENSLPINTEYRCWVGSITKTVTALLFSQFLDQGLVDLDDSLATVFPEYPLHDRHVPTFRQCFNHTSGLSGHGMAGGVRNPNLENIVLNAIDVNEPNARYAYTGTGFELAAKAMEIVTGKTAVRLYDEHLFQPLDFGDVPMGDASSGGEFTAWELGILAQWVANRGSYGDLEFISRQTFDRLLPEPLHLSEGGPVQEEGIGMHWERRLRPGAPPNSDRPEDRLFSLQTVRHGSFSGCIFVVDLDQQIVVVQARRRGGPRSGEWSARLFQTIAEAVANDEPATP